MKKIIIIFFILCFLNSSAQNKTELYILKYKDIAVNEMNIYLIPASITLAQAILESGSGESRLAVDGLNHFGIKCHDNWNGEFINEDDDEKQECFRKYDKVEESYRDHSLFLSERSRYSFLFDYKRTDYKAWAKGLKKAGYATNPQYADLLIDLIEKYNLDIYDKSNQVMSKRLYLAHTYGIPYLTGLGMYYFTPRNLVCLEIQTSFIFTNLTTGLDYKLWNEFYVGGHGGVIYLPTEKESIVPQLSFELSYNKISKNERYSSILIKSGVQYPLTQMEYKLIPYLSLVYLVN